MMAKIIEHFRFSSHSNGMSKSNVTFTQLDARPSQITLYHQCKTKNCRQFLYPTMGIFNRCFSDEKSLFTLI